jgi:hypothetical protein
MIDVRAIPTHGGSLRLFVTHQNKRTSHRRVNDLLALEKKANLTNIEGYMGFQPKVEAIKKHLLELLSTSKQSCNQIVGYGAAAKGNTLLQYCNIDTDLITWIADASPRKQGCFTPGTHIPIVSTDRFAIDLPDEVLILPWNISNEIISFLQGLKIKKLNKAYVSIPTPRVIAL